MDYTNEIKELREMCDTVFDEIAEANKKIKASGGKVSAGDAAYRDTLTHTLKSIKTTMAMMEAEGDGEEGYSGHYMMPYYGRSYAGNRGGSYEGMEGRSYRGNSYARGRGARRDSMGRYSREGYSRAAGDLAEQLYDLMEEAPNDQIKHDMQRLAEKLGQM